MTEDMLTISKIELGALTSRLRPLDLTSLVKAAIPDRASACRLCTRSWPIITGS